MGDEDPKRSPRNAGQRATIARSIPVDAHLERRSPERDLEQLLREVARPAAGFDQPSAALAFGGTSRFQVLRRLGAGGFGVVYLVRDVAVGADVALKTLPVARPELIYRLKREFRTLADLRHSNLTSRVARSSSTCAATARSTSAASAWPSPSSCAASPRSTRRASCTET